MGYGTCSCNNQLKHFTGNILPSTITSSGNQMFISYTNNGDGAPGKGFSASYTSGKKIINFDFFESLQMKTFLLF